MSILDTLPPAHPESGWIGVVYDKATFEDIVASATWCDIGAIRGTALFPTDTHPQMDNEHPWLDTIGRLDEDLYTALGITKDPTDHDSSDPRHVYLSGIGRMPDGQIIFMVYLAGLGRSAHLFMTVPADHPAVHVIQKRWAARAKKIEEFIARLTQLGMRESTFTFPADKP